MRGKIFLFIVVTFLLISSVSAASQINISVINDKVDIGGKARFNLSITNEAVYTQTYRTSSPFSGVGWSVEPRPLRNQVLNIGAGMRKSTLIEVTPLTDFRDGVYIIPLKITTDKESYSEQLKVYFGEFEVKTYLPSINLNIDINSKIDPKESQLIRVSLENKNILDLSNTTFLIKSEMEEFNVEQRIDLGPYEKKVLEFTINPNPYQQPKDYYLFFTLVREGETIKVTERKIEILPLTPDFEVNISEEKFFLRSIHRILIENEGNVRNTQEVMYKVGFLERFFMRSDSDSVVKKVDGKRYMVWELELGADEAREINLKESYRVPFLILVLMIILTVLYYIYRSPVTITKSASNVLMSGGGVAGLKVTMIVKNTSSKPLKDVEIIDSIPSIVNIEKDVEMGTMKPTDTFRSRTGKVKIRWRLAELDGKEERVISYKIKSKLNIVGTLKLPRAKVNFRDGKGKMRKSYSNKYTIST